MVRTRTHHFTLVYDEASQIFEYSSKVDRKLIIFDGENRGNPPILFFFNYIRRLLFTFII